MKWRLRPSWVVICFLSGFFPGAIQRFMKARNPPSKFKKQVADFDAASGNQSLSARGRIIVSHEIFAISFSPKWWSIIHIRKKDLSAKDKQFFPGCKQFSAVRIHDRWAKKITAHLISFLISTLWSRAKTIAKALCLIVRTNCSPSVSRNKYR